ncbi:thiamine-phosphate kinase [Rhodopirellula sp. MGV]|uniref:thiamine-phosphate kinase n=1 Tax=Rhodopirellula sp. MGV TaxID=2023130 RepID=UPI000B974AA4|nr:thiamine-phosphate kinase [Rhodopirellula sp. MGV]OYP35520.1 thiamine-monophosphate kinase [Rhodopirellula sp. MGV]PNY34483.1 thiamine-monophosphate kinase [Rhodopirellula baltica]
MEQSFLAYLRGRTRGMRQVDVGIGDDAAVISVPANPIVVCADQIIDGTDFDSENQSLSDIGYKAMAINLSDIAAMGAVADSAIVTLALPQQDATKIAGDCYEGILEAAKRFNVAIAGGDLSTYDGPLSINVTLLGHVPNGGKPWLRSDAQEGDVVLASGSFGGSLRGRHLRPEPRIELAQAIRELADVHAAIDVSDGFSLDLDRLCASSGYGVELDVDAVPVHPDATSMSAKSGKSAFHHAWSDGEDFELLLTVSPEDAERLLAASLPAPLTAVGKIIGRTGLWKMQSGKYIRMAPQGYQHTE